MSGPTSAHPPLSPAEFAKRAGISLDTTRRLIASGELPAWRIGPRLIRIDAAELKKIRRPVTPTAAYRAARGGDDA